jgi:hypothetical protein
MKSTPRAARDAHMNSSWVSFLRSGRDPTKRFEAMAIEFRSLSSPSQAPSVPLRRFAVRYRCVSAVRLANSAGTVPSNTFARKPLQSRGR